MISVKLDKGKKLRSVLFQHKLEKIQLAQQSHVFPDINSHDEFQSLEISQS
jgi:hypothetical protein